MFNNIHRVWFGNENTSDNNYHLKSFEQYLPDWCEKKWGSNNLEETKKLVNNIEPKLSICFDKYSEHTSLLSDVIRYCALYEYGGVYTDYDVELFSEKFLFEILRESHLPLFIIETVLSDKMYERSAQFPNRNGINEHKVRIASYMLYSPPHNPIIKSVINLIAERLNLGIKPKDVYDIIWLAGPDTISTIVNTTQEDFNIINEEDQHQICSHKCTGVNTWRMLF